MEINSPNQPINPPETPIQPVSKPVNNKKGFLPIILGVLLLLALIGGGVYYLEKQNSINTQTKNISTQPTQSSTSLTPEEWKNIFTTKQEYEIGNTIFPIVTNTLNSKIYYEFTSCSDKSHLPPKAWLEKLEANNQWKEQADFMNYMQSCGGSTPNIDCQEINPNESSSYGIALDYNDNAKNTVIPYSVGTYRLKMKLGKNCTKGNGLEKPRMVYSNEFIIKDQPKVSVKFSEVFKLNPGQEAIIVKNISGKDSYQRVILKDIRTEGKGLSNYVADLEFWDNDLKKSFSLTQFDRNKQFGNLNINIERIDLFSIKLSISQITKPNISN